MPGAGTSAHPLSTHPLEWCTLAVLGPLGLLLLATTLGWCVANSAWTAAAWRIPNAHLDEKSDTYLDPEYGDTFITLAVMRAAGDGRILPLASKTVPELGAPSVANWNDWPLIEEPQTILLGLLGRWLGPFAGLNAGILLGHLLAAATMYSVCVVVGCALPWAFVAGLAYGLSPIIFAQSPHHVTVAWAWHVPLFLLAWQWAADPQVGPGGRRFRCAAVIGLIAGVQNPYYTNILCQLALLSGAVSAWRGRSWRHLRTAAAIVAAAAAGFAVMNVDSWSHRLFNGPNPGAVLREYKWLEIYALKLVDLVIPTASHRSDWFAGIARAHRAAAPLLNEGATYLGIVGILALGWLVGVSVRALAERRGDDVPAAFWQVLWIVLCFGTGGFNAFGGLIGITLFRTACRYSIVILAIVLLFAARRASTLLIRDRRHTTALLAAWAGAVALSLLVWWDEVPRPTVASVRERIARHIDSDRDFLARVETALPPGAMVFQLPIMEFPESPIPGIGTYDQLRPYIFSKHLRWSFGAIKGRPKEDWLKTLPAKELKEAVADIRSHGFSAILLHRNGFPDKGRAIEGAVVEMTGPKSLLRSDEGDLSCIILDPVPPAR